MLTFLELFCCLPKISTGSLGIVLSVHDLTAAPIPARDCSGPGCHFWLPAESLFPQHQTFLQRCHLPGIQEVMAGQFPAVLIWQPNLKVPSGLSEARVF